MNEPLPKSLAEVMASIEGSGDPTGQLIKLIVERQQESNPELAQAIQYCAIPRRFDAAMIGALRDAPGDNDGNEKILGGVSGYNFVVPRRGGGYVYHDSARTALLKEWRVPDRLTSFLEFNNRAFKFYERQQQANQEIETSLGRVSQLIQKVSRARYTQLTIQFSAQFLWPYLEALYHKSLVSAADLFDAFEGYYFSLEAAGRISVCQAMLQATRDYLKLEYPGDVNTERPRWLQYYEGRIDRVAGEFSKCEMVLNALLPQAEDLPKLSIWILGELGACLRAEGKLRESGEVLDRLVSVSNLQTTDAWNRSVWLLRAAQLRQDTEELDKADDLSRMAIGAAKEAGNDGTLGACWLTRSTILQSLGQFKESVDAAFEALDISRTTATDNIALQSDVMVALGFLAASQSNELLETLNEEQRAQFPPDAKSEDLLRLRVICTQMLYRGSQFVRTAQVVEQAMADFPDLQDTPLWTELLFRAALARDELGQFDRALKLYDEVIDRFDKGLTEPGLYSSALHNHGVLQVDLCQWEAAEADFAKARQAFDKMGHTVLASFARNVERARMSCKLGRIQEAEETLELADKDMTPNRSSYLPDFYLERARVYNYSGRFEKAIADFREAAALSEGAGRWKRAATAYGHLLGIAVRMSNWDDAAKWAGKVRDLAFTREALEKYTYSSEFKTANDEDARAIRYLFTEGSQRRESRTLARDLLRSACDRMPDYFWYYLNLSYVCAELGDWVEAAKSLETALAKAPAIWRSPVLERRIAAYRARLSASSPAPAASPA
jgi:tetratricopeptide (TPR) repeat protein